MAILILRALALTALSASAFAQPFLYVSNQNGNTISVINLRTGAVAATMPTPFSPAGLALTPDGARLFAASPNGNFVVAYSTTTNALQLSAAIGQAPVALATDSSRVYVAINNSAALAVYNAATLQLQVQTRVGFGPSAVAVSPANGRVYVANTFSNTLSVLDPTRIGTPNPLVIASIPVPGSPVAIAMSPDGSTAWVASAGSPALTRIDLSSNSVTSSIPLPLLPAGLAMAPDGLRLYVTGYGPAVLPVETSSGNLGSPIELPSCTAPRCVAMGAAVSADSRTLYVANTSRNQVAVINLETSQVTTNINVQGAPRGLALGPAPRP